MNFRLPLAFLPVFWMGFSPVLPAQSLQLDPDFGSDGIWYSTEGFSSKLNLNPDNSLILCGSTSVMPPSEFDGIVTRILPKGAIDLDFGNTGFMQLSFDDLFNGNYPYEGFSASIRLDDGRIVVVGSKGPFITGLPGKLILAVLKPNGQLDTDVFEQGRKLIELDGFSANAAGLFKCSNGDFILWSDLRIEFAAAEKSHLAMIRFHPDGTVDTSFGPNGNGQVIHLIAPASPFYGVLPSPRYKFTPEDQLLICGTSTINTFCLNRFNPDGSQDVSFGVNGQAIIQVGIDIQVHDMELQQDGKILVFGSSRVQGDPVFTIVRLNKDGSLDNSWANGGILINDISTFDNVINLGAVFSNGKVLVAGWRLLDNGEKEFLLAQYQHNGSPDLSFGNNGIQALELGDGYIYLKELLIGPDQAVYLFSSTFSAATSLTLLSKFLPDNEVFTITPALNSLNASLSPNLFAAGGSGILSFELPDPAILSAHLLDAQGAQVQTLFAGETCQPGKHIWQLHLSESLPAGLYRIQLKAGNAQSLLPVLLKR